MAEEKIAYISFLADIGPTSVEGLLNTCGLLATQGVGEVHLLLSTTGGLVANGITAYNVLRGMPFKLVTHNTGAVDSIGNAVFLAGEERFACPDTTFLFHGIKWNFAGPTQLDAKGLREILGSIAEEEKKIQAVITERTGLPPDAVGKMFAEATIKRPEAAKAAGIIHEVRRVEIPPGVPVHQLMFQR